jgi:DNA-binding MarR family transcriptional regulator
MTERSESKSDRLRRHLPGESDPGSPLVGALLRFAVEKVQDRMLAALAKAGFADISLAHLKVLRFPPPDDDRPGVLAARAKMTKQAMNYLLVQLEELGYVRRTETEDAAARLVSLTDRGWKVGALQRGTVRAIERDWAAKVGEKRFAIFMEVLREIASDP